jgi:hypothetical protein
MGTDRGRKGGEGRGTRRTGRPTRNCRSTSRRRLIVGALRLGAVVLGCSMAPLLCWLATSRVEGASSYTDTPCQEKFGSVPDSVVARIVAVAVLLVVTRSTTSATRLRLRLFWTTSASEEKLRLALGPQMSRAAVPYAAEGKVPSQMWMPLMRSRIPTAHWPHGQRRTPLHCTALRRLLVTGELLLPQLPRCRGVSTKHERQLGLELPERGLEVVGLLLLLALACRGSELGRRHILLASLLAAVATGGGRGLDFAFSYWRPKVLPEECLYC